MDEQLTRCPGASLVVLVQILLAVLGTNAYQGSIKWWVLRHRLHHRYTDTEHDPYNSQRGFYYSHMGVSALCFAVPPYSACRVLPAACHALCVLLLP